MSDQPEPEGLSATFEAPAGTFTFESQRATDVLARRVRELRNRQGMSAQKLADRCTELGMPSLNRAVISTIENGRRQDVSLEETLMLAHALNIAPVHLFVPLEPQAMQVGRWTIGAAEVRAWVRGFRPLTSVADKRFYATEVPDEEWPPPKPPTFEPPTDEERRERAEALKRLAAATGGALWYIDEKTGERRRVVPGPVDGRDDL